MKHLSRRIVCTSLLTVWVAASFANAANLVGDADNDQALTPNDARLIQEALYGTNTVDDLSPLALIDDDLDLDLRDLLLAAQIAATGLADQTGPALTRFTSSGPGNFSTVSGNAPTLLFWSVNSALPAIANRTEGLELSISVITAGAESFLANVDANVAAGGVATAEFNPVNTTGAPVFVTAQMLYEVLDSDGDTVLETGGSSVTVLVGPSSCGNGVTEPGEECDDFADGDDCNGCTDACVFTDSLCGNGVTDCFEYCDDAGETAACNADCTWASCGDGNINATAGEICDDGAANGTDGFCTPDCQGAQNCGNGAIEGTETCDDGNVVSGDGCDAICQCEPITIPFFEGWESGAIDQCIWTVTGTGTYRTEVTTNFTPATGLNHLAMDSSVDNNYSLNEATLRIDLAGQSNVVVEFVHSAYDDESNPLPANWIGNANGDGIAVSVDGVNWSLAYDLAPFGDEVNVQREFDLDAVMIASGMAYADPTFIRFQQYDNYELTTDGHLFDDIRIYVPVCGNLATEFVEECDDGMNGDPCDGCTDACLLTASFCGNMLIECSESCDDGPMEGPGLCVNDCSGLQTCGDGSVNGTELCDDGNLLPGDGCDGLCRLEGTCGLEVIPDGFTDISATGFNVGSSDDDDSIPAAIGFNFSYFGVPYANLNISSNGFFSFTDAAYAYSNQNLPSANNPNNVVAPLWDDLDTFNGDIFTQLNGPAGNQVFTIQWNEINRLYATPNTLTFQAKLYESSGIIEFHYAKLDDAAVDGSSTVGLEDATGTFAIERSYNGSNPVMVGESLLVRPDACLGVCGDGVIDPLEANPCDDGANGDPCDGCTDACQTTVSLCGNALPECAESCDDGPLEGEGSCLSDCSGIQTCGDTFVNGTEGCDDGNTVSEGEGSCAGDCSGIQTCGDSIPNGTETCDDGPALGEGACLNDCSGLQTCGDGAANGDEVCDDGGDTLACDGDCTAPLCGDGYLNPIVGEQCDDGNLIAGDGCSSVCLTEQTQCSTSPIFLAGLPIVPAPALDVAVLGDFAYVVADDGWLYTVDVTVPALPAVVDSDQVGFPSCGGAGEIETLSNLIVATCNNSIYYFDPTITPAYPSLADSYTHPSVLVDLDVDPISGLAATITDTELLIHDVSSPFSPVTPLNFPSTPLPSGFGVNVTLQMPLAYAGNSFGNIDIFDIAAPPAPSFIATEFPTVQMNSLDVIDGFLWVGDGPLLWSMIDLFPPLFGLGLAITPDTVRAVESTLGQRLVVANEFSGLGLVDVFDPFLPAILSNTFGSPGAAVGVDAENNYAYIANNIGALDIFDLCPGTCGNSFVENGEGCDDGNLTDGDGCDSACQPENCGDGVAQPALMEECDDGANGDDCDGCTDGCLLTATLCGNGTPECAEACDDGPANGSGDGFCLTDCSAVQTCGDGFLFGTEECDEMGETASCDADCTFVVCGDGTLNASALETCDDGPNNGAGDGFCLADCSATQFCPDGVANGSEACDDNGESAACNADCTLATCGDGLINASAGEVCDDGPNNGAGDGFCLSDCSGLQLCGDGAANGTEQCDDGGTCFTTALACTNGPSGSSCIFPPGDPCVIASGDGCSDTCEIEICGNGVVDAGETCDDGANNGVILPSNGADNELFYNGRTYGLYVGGNNWNAAAANCASLGGYMVSINDAAENDAIRAFATATSSNAPWLGGTDQNVEGDWEWDSGDPFAYTLWSAAAPAQPDGGAAENCMRFNGAGDPSWRDASCSNNARSICEFPSGCNGSCDGYICGDALVHGAEACDDGPNNGAGDGFCLADCSGVESCGDGVTNGAEACDDGALLNGTGDGFCLADCSGTQLCGDGSVNGTETCDAAPNGDDCDGCTDLCQTTGSLCGDGVVGCAEACDDGIDNGGGEGFCTADCSDTQLCGDGVAQGTEGCDDAGESATCNADCTVSTCGDTVLNVTAGEECDDGPANSDLNPLACRNDCTLYACGDAVTDDETVTSVTIEWVASGCSGGMPDDLIVNVNGSTLLWTQAEPVDSCNLCLPAAGPQSVTLSGPAVPPGMFVDGVNQVDVWLDNFLMPPPTTVLGYVIMTVNTDVKSVEYLLWDSGDPAMALARDTTICAYPGQHPAGDFNQTTFEALSLYGEACDDGQGQGDGYCLDDCSGVQDCGDGIQEGTEMCDDGDGACQFSLSLCGSNYDCTPGVCAFDPFFQCWDDIECPIPGDTCVGVEQCVIADGEGLCLNDCSGVQSCGDGVVVGTEECDDGNTVSEGEGGCAADCSGVQICGDGLLTGTEVCDNSGDPCAFGCNATCSGAFINQCGDGVVCGGEQCDDGAANGNAPDACRFSCTFPTCGDGIHDPAFGETCDDGPPEGDGLCANDCSGVQTCGDTFITGTETCDEGALNGDPNSCCDGTCGLLPPGLVCNSGSGDMCNPDEICDGFNGSCPVDDILPDGAGCLGCPSGICSCQLGVCEDSCGNDLIDGNCTGPGEFPGVPCDCGPDDLCGNGDDNLAFCADPFTASCAIAFEMCDEGAANDDFLPDACRTNCMEPTCGDAVCDPSYTESCTLCTLDCPACVCGNGALEPGEQCDDGNNNDGDCCSSACFMEAGSLSFSDDFETGAPGWTSYSLSGLPQSWQLSNARSDSGTSSYWTGVSSPGNANYALESPAISVELNSNSILSFDHWYDFDDCGVAGDVRDAGIVEISADGGGPAGTWTKLHPVSAYPYLFNDVCVAYPTLTEVYGSDNGLGSFAKAYFDLSAYEGQTINVRFNAFFDCGNCVATEAWYVDDVEVYGGCSGPPPGCGDLYCDALIGEDCNTCGTDCGACPVCGDFICQPGNGENGTTCPSDCFCGDGNCKPNDGESLVNCPIDCVPPPCGDGTCDSGQGENEANCPLDCFCGDGQCNFWDNEDCGNCPDCFCGSCGDGVCEIFSGETQAFCGDCFCGDGVCNPKDGEDFNACPVDCPMPNCGDSICNPLAGESQITCGDCVCGDGVCDFTTEDNLICPIDCAP